MLPSRSPRRPAWWPINSSITRAGTAPSSSQVVSQEGFQAYERLCELARTLGLDAHYEVIPPPGLVDLNRDNLVVICGPRLSPIIAQVLASDPNLGFAHDDHGG